MKCANFNSFIHLKEIKFVSVNSALHVYKAADKYDLPDLCSVVNKFILASITVGNVCQIYEHSQLHNVSEIKEVCKRIFVQETEKVLTSQDFLRSQVSTVNDIYTTNGLEIESEQILCDTLVRYVTKHKLTLNDVRRYLRPCLTSIRFFTLQPDTIQGLDRILSKQEQKAIKSAILDHTMLKSYRMLKHFNTSRKPRYTKEAPEYATLNDKYLYSYYF